MTLLHLLSLSWQLPHYNDAIEVPAASSLTSKQSYYDDDDHVDDDDDRRYRAPRTQCA